MLYSEIFSLANKFVLLGWLLLLIAPKWKYTETISTSIGVLLLSLLYSVLIILQLTEFDWGSFSTLENVKKLFQKDEALLAGWVNYLAFDLFIGIYILKQTQALKITHLANLFLLPITFFFGPLGYIIFVITKFLKSKYELF